MTQRLTETDPLLEMLPHINICLKFVMKVYFILRGEGGGRREARLGGQGTFVSSIQVASSDISESILE